MNKSRLSRIVVSTCLSVILFIVSAMPVFAANPLLEAYNNLLTARPYSQQYVDCTQKLYDAVVKDSSADEKLKADAKVLLNSATARISFMMEDTISRLGNEIDMTVTNYGYVNETLLDIKKVYAMKMMERRSPRNDSTYKLFAEKASSFERMKAEITAIEGVIANLSDQSTANQVQNAFKQYQVLDKDRYLVSKSGVSKLISLVQKHKLDTKDLNIPIIESTDLHLQKLTDTSKLKTTATAKDLPSKIEKQLLDGYKVVDSFKLTVNNKGGEISPSVFTFNQKTQNLFLVDNEGKVYRDVDDNMGTVSFETNKLGDYYVVEQVSFYPYTTNYSTKLEWKFQNAAMQRLLYESKVLSSNKVDFVPNDIKTIPRSVLDTISKTNQTIVIKGAEDVSLLPKAVADIPVKYEFVQVEYLYSYAKSTQQKEEYLSPLPDTTDAQSKLDLPADLFVETGESGLPSTEKLLALAGVVVALAAIAFLVRKEQKTKI